MTIHYDPRYALPMVRANELCTRARNHYLTRRGIDDPGWRLEVRFGVPTPIASQARTVGCICPTWPTGSRACPTASCGTLRRTNCAWMGPTGEVWRGSCDPCILRGSIAMHVK